MQCPACKNELIIVEHQRVEIDYCPHCSGIWLDEGELHLLVDDPAQITAMLKAIRNESKSSRRCPICRAKMVIGIVGTTQVDDCPKGHGVWFDKGELEKVLAESKSEINSEIITFLKDVFGRAK